MANNQTSAAEAEALASMEGFYEKGKGQGLLFFQLFDGSICLKSREVPTEEGWEVEPIETKHPRTKALVYTYVKRFDKLIVRVGDVNKRQKEFDEGGKVTNWNFTVLAGKKRAILQTVWMDALLQKFLKVAPNIDFTKPILFGAFRKTEKGKTKQLIRIAQGGSGPNSDDWVAVPWYWKKKEDKKGNVDLDSPAVGADGTVLPDPIHDEEEDEWDFKPQNKFLAKHFVENTLPGIKKIADELGLSHKMIADDDDDTAGKSADFPTHTGGPEIPVVTKRPKNPESESVNDAMTPGQAKELRKLAKQIGKTVEAVSQKFLEIGFDELSIEGAAYLKYKMEKRIAKAREEDPDAYPEPVETKKKPAPPVEDDDDDDDDEDEAPKKSSKKSDDDDDDEDWGAAPAPKSSQKKKKPKSDDDDDDDEDWGKHDDNVLRDKNGNVIF